MCNCKDISQEKSILHIPTWSLPFANYVSLACSCPRKAKLRRASTVRDREKNMWPGITCRSTLVMKRYSRQAMPNAVPKSMPTVARRNSLDMRKKSHQWMSYATQRSMYLAKAKRSRASPVGRSSIDMKRYSCQVMPRAAPNAMPAVACTN